MVVKVPRLFGVYHFKRCSTRPPIFKPNNDNMLDLQMLGTMPGDTIFAQGEGDEPTLYKDGPIRWVAVRWPFGNAWSLHYHHAKHDWQYIKAHGDKSFTESTIRRLVPCTDEAWRCYGDG